MRFLLVTIILAVGVVSAFGQGAVRRVDALTNLLVLNPKAIATDGKVSVETAGRFTPGDGGGAIYDWHSSASDSTNLGAVLPVSGGGGRWKVRNWDGNVRVFGAKGDGTTDDSAAVQAALTYSSATGKPVYFPTGTYVVANLVATAGSENQLIMIGDKPFGSKQVSESRSVLKLKGSSAATASLLTAVSGSPITIRNLAFDGNRSNNASVTNALIRLEGTGYDETLLQNVAVFHAPAVGVYITRDETRLEHFYVLYAGSHGVQYYNTTDHQVLYGLFGYCDGDGINGDQLYYSRFTEVDSYQHKGWGIYLTNAINSRMTKVQPQDNWKGGLGAMCAGLYVTEGNILRNNIDTNYHGANPYASGAYPEVALFGTFQYATFVSGEIGDRSVKTKYPSYLIDDQRTLADAQKGLGVNLLGVTMSTTGYTAGRWQTWTERNSRLTAIYDVITGRYLDNNPLQQATVSSGYPYTVKRDENVLILSGTGRHVILPSTNSVPDGWLITIVDASGTAETNNIAVSAVDGFVYGVATNRLYDPAGIWTFVKSGVNYGLQSFSSSEQVLIGDMSYRWTTRNGPRLTITTDQSRDSGGVPLVLSGYRSSGTDFNILQFEGSGGTIASPSGLASNSTPGQIRWKARLADGSESGNMARILAVPDATPTTTNQATSLLLQTTAGAGGGARYARMGPNGNWSFRDDGGADGPGNDSVLDVVSSSRGMLPPRLSTAQRTGISGPRDGLLAFDTDLDRYYYVSNGVWVVWGDVPVVTGVGVTNVGGLLSVNLAAGSNITFTTNASGNLTIASSGGGGGGPTNGTSLSVDGAFLSAANLSDGADINFNASGTNVTGTVQANSVALGTDTTEPYVATIAGTASEISVSGSGSETAAVTISLPSTVDVTGKTLLVATQSTSTSNTTAASTAYVKQVVAGISSGGGGTNVTVNSTNVTGFEDSADIVFTISGGIASPQLAEDVSLTTLRVNELVISNVLGVAVGASGRSNLTANAYIAGNGTNAVSLVGPTAKALAGWNDSGTAAAITTGVGVTNLGGVLSANYSPGSNVTFTTNANGNVTITASTGGAGTTVSVDGAAAAAVNFQDGSEITFTLTTTNVTAAVANDAIDYGQIQNVSAASRLLGRGSASGSGDVQELTIGGGLALNGTSLILSNNFTTGHYAGGFLPLYAGVSNFLYGALHYRAGSDIRSPMWETNTAFEAVGMRANNGLWSVVQYSTNDFSVIETMLEVDASLKSGGTNSVTIPNGGFNNLLSVEPNALFGGDVEFQGAIALGASAAATTASAGASNTTVATTAYVDRAVQVSGTNTLQTVSVTIFDPDGVQAVSDAVPLLAVESTWAPNGITIKDIYLKTDASSTYAINLEEWTSPTDGAPVTIEAVTTSSSTEAEDDGTLSDATVAAGSIVFVDLPTTTANWISVSFTYFVK